MVKFYVWIIEVGTAWAGGEGKEGPGDYSMRMRYIN